MLRKEGQTECTLAFCMNVKCSISCSAGGGWGGVEVAERVLPVFGQKWPTVSGRTSQLGPELHPRQPETGEQQHIFICSWLYSTVSNPLTHLFAFSQTCSCSWGYNCKSIMYEPTDLSCVRTMWITHYVSTLMPTQQQIQILYESQQDFFWASDHSSSRERPTLRPSTVSGCVGVGKLSYSPTSYT